MECVRYHNAKLGCVTAVRLHWREATHLYRWLDTRHQLGENVAATVAEHTVCNDVSSITAL